MAKLAKTPTEKLHEEIAALARTYWEKEGRPEGRDKDHWFRAEAEIRSRAPIQAAPKATLNGSKQARVRA